MDFIEIAKKRYSARSYKGKKVEEEIGRMKTLESTGL